MIQQQKTQVKILFIFFIFLYFLFTLKINLIIEDIKQGEKEYSSGYAITQMHDPSRLGQNGLEGVCLTIFSRGF